MVLVVSFPPSRRFWEGVQAAQAKALSTTRCVFCFGRSMLTLQTASTQRYCGALGRVPLQRQ